MSESRDVGAELGWESCRSGITCGRTSSVSITVILPPRRTGATVQESSASVCSLAKRDKGHAIYRVQPRVEASDYREHNQSAPTRDFAVDAPSEEQLWRTKDQREQGERNIETGQVERTNRPRIRR